MTEARSGGQAERQLIERCLAGQPGAATEFQQRYGDLIYNYPMRVYRMPAEDAGDFYVFAFDNGRIFRRAQSFAGRTSLRAYLSGFVLDNLVLEWKRGAREVETVSIEVLGELPAAGPSGAPDEAGASLNELLASIDVAKAVMLKLLYIEDCDLEAADLRWLAETSGRRLPDLLDAIDVLREHVRQREMHLKAAEDALDSAHAWIQLYERRLRQIADTLADLPAASTAAARLLAERVELERKLPRRQRQRTLLRARAQRRKVTAPYKDIAALLHTTVGNVASQILRARKELGAKVSLPDAPSGCGDQHD